MSKENMDSKIMQLFEVVRKQRDEVAKAEEKTKQSWKTNCTITIGSSPTPQNLQTTKEKALCQLVADLMIRREYQRQAAEFLGLPADDTYQNFSFDDWLSDCSKRINLIQIKEKKEKLNELEQRLQAIVSPEQKRLMELESISKSLGL